MKIRATILTPVLAVFTVVALVGTGIVISQTRQEDASATALDSMPASAVVTAATAATVADAGLTENIEPAAAVQSTAPSAKQTPPLVPSTVADDELSGPGPEEDDELDAAASEGD